jgi:hypothetical protein
MVITYKIYQTFELFFLLKSKLEFIHNFIQFAFAFDMFDVHLHFFSNFILKI